MEEKLTATEDRIRADMKEQIGALATQLNGRMDVLETRLSKAEATVQRYRLSSKIMPSSSQ